MQWAVDPIYPSPVVQSSNDYTMNDQPISGDFFVATVFQPLSTRYG